MIAAIQSKKSVSEEEYLQIDREGNREKNGKCEYFNNSIKLVPDGSHSHNLILSNINFTLVLGLRTLKSECSVLSNVKVVCFDKANNYFYPDSVISDGKVKAKDKNEDILTNPLVIVEVLSDSTEGFDRGDKFKSYRNIPSLKEYLLVSQNENCIEQFYKDENGRWQFGEIVTTGSLKLKSIDIEIAIDDVYFNIESESNQEE